MASIKFLPKNSIITAMGPPDPGYSETTCSPRRSSCRIPSHQYPWPAPFQQLALALQERNPAGSVGLLDLVLGIDFLSTDLFKVQIETLAFFIGLGNTVCIRGVIGHDETAFTYFAIDNH